MKVPPSVQVSGYLEKCCLLLSANESYARSAQNIEVLTGIKVSHSTQHRLVHRHAFAEPVVAQTVTEMSLDGGKVRLRTPLGEPCIWNDYKALRLHELATVAYFKDNLGLIGWVNQQRLDTPFLGLGDGHDGIWNVFAQIGTPEQRYEILDWFHLIENLNKVPGSLKRIKRVENLLWQGKVDAAIEQFTGCNSCETSRFVDYLNKHRSRIPNYEYLHKEGFCIGSGEVESAIKQIGRRVKISGAQWASKNVPQLLKHCCAYLNGYFSIAPQQYYSEHLYSAQN
jgi:hypothetical protein